MKTATVSKLGETSVNTETKIKIKHKGFSDDNIIQQFVSTAFKLGGLEFTTMIECENGKRDYERRGDNGESLGFCQLNGRRHKEIFEKRFREDRKHQLNICFQKWKGGTKFYGPYRIIKGQYCKNYVQDRFYIITK